MNSEHLRKIVDNEHGIHFMQVVFCDVESYSKRNTQAQVKVINQLTDVVLAVVRQAQMHHNQYFFDNELSLPDDLIMIPTGDGVAAVFTFPGLHQLHFHFAQALLMEAEEVKSIDSCPDFISQGWCNCHGCFNLRIGVSAGQGVIYRDVNGSYNAAGSTVNLASRIMNVAEPIQILLSEEAYQKLADLSSDSAFAEDFEIMQDVVLKGECSVNIYKFIGAFSPWPM